MNNTLIIAGAGAHARKLYHYATELGLTVSAFLDDNPTPSLANPGIPCIPFNDAISLGSLRTFIVALGNASLRKQTQESLESLGWVPTVLIHPTAYVAPDALIGAGTVICAQAVVETGVSIGVGGIVDIGVLIDHDTVIGDYCHLKAGETFQPRSRVLGL